MEMSGPFKGDVGPLGQNHHPATQTLDPLGLLQPTECAKQAQHTALCSRKRPANPGGVQSI
jgi:hypothetical protein